MAHTFTHLLTHIIFSTKDRRPLLDADLKSPLPGRELYWEYVPTASAVGYYRAPLRG